MFYQRVESHSVSRDGGGGRPRPLGLDSGGWWGEPEVRVCRKGFCAERDEGLLSGPVELGFTVMKAALKWTRVGAKCLIEHSLL